MKAWEEYAFVVDGMVQSVGVFAVGGYTDACNVARASYGESAKAINVSQIPTKKGDIYRDGTFYRKDAEGNETEVPVIPSEEEQLDVISQTTTSNVTAIDSNTGAIDDILVMLLNSVSAEV